MIIPFVHHLVFSFINICVKSDLLPLVCTTTWPNLYSYVQEKYWNVGLFSYFQLNNGFFIVIGAPAIIISTYGVLTHFKSEWNLIEKGIYLSFLILLVMTICFTNIQSSTRFFSTHPIFYLILASLSLKWKLVRFWIMFYCLMGILLYTVAFPWTWSLFIFMFNNLLFELTKKKHTGFEPGSSH